MSYIKEQDKIVKKLNIDLIILRKNLHLTYLYEIIEKLFLNDSVIVSNTDIILITLYALSDLTFDDKNSKKILENKIIEKNIGRHVKLVKYSIKSIKNLSNIILKDDEIITNVEQFINNKKSPQILYHILSYVTDNRVGMRDFYDWYLTGNRNKQSFELLKYIKSDMKQK